MPTSDTPPASLLRQPIVVVLGHVDHGKTTLLDKIRQSKVALKEAGKITQHIGASEITAKEISEIGGDLVNRFKLAVQIPGLLFLDTPGHEAFTSLRERGGSLADIAVLVIDVRQGIQPQTLESIRILKQFKTPFLVALTKIDQVDGWKKTKHNSFLHSLEEQAEHVQQKLDNYVYKLVESLYLRGFECERFDRITDFTRQITIVPVSAVTGEGIAELLLFLTGLSQRYLSNGLGLGKTIGKGSIIEVRTERGLGTVLDVVLYEGTLRKNDKIIFSTMNGVAESRVRCLVKPSPKGIEYVDSVSAASGVRIVGHGLDDALPGSPIAACGLDDSAEAGEMEQQVKSILFESAEDGIIVVCDTLGSVEAMLNLLKKENIPVKKTKVGKLTRDELTAASAVSKRDRYLGAIMTFNIGESPAVITEAESLGVKVFAGDVVYSIIENYQQWAVEEREREKSEVLTSKLFPAKIKIIQGCCFRKSRPCVVGVEVLEGKLVSGITLMNKEGMEIGEVKSIQHENETIPSAEKGKKVAISIEGKNAIFEKCINFNDTLYSRLPLSAVREMLNNAKLFTELELALLSELEQLLLRERKIG
ncbi:translation initiation factor IF-2 [Candidatus Micrarchaeota archaeon CG08_land_8_20_14_0_20_49_17]|nr:MAG: translation initiation factor IF-2 [Candidatus Micrarchaeota archaeon CG1_02_49_24]PIU10147.1 MAG: translation initiation factor IF-2 [Candidatus Micrarchaeota archaeon CG08_land_8_20_14_0_20_49_17]PIU81162.1 MAG: translation initiation factor IF-2 [Candidatus Micrarchaeota archaeon CG06_land_8_20_14_3_00_50_6]HII53596.1 translation initiation factor IF-2 [Candidatus Micrarchaeota archaeon]